jgi:hypothetical protein
MTQGRMDKTVDKMRRGGLPAPTQHTRVVALGDGRPCAGCGETVHPGLEWRLHEMLRGLVDVHALARHHEAARHRHAGW